MSSQPTTLSSEDWLTLKQRGWTGPLEVNAKDSFGTPVLFYALGDFSCLRNGEVVVLNLKNGTVALDLAQKLIDAGADPHAVDQYEQNAWFYCLDLKEGAALLMKYGVDINRPDIFGMSGGAFWIMDWNTAENAFNVSHHAFKNGIWLIHHEEAYREEVLESLFQYGLQTEYEYISPNGNHEIFDIALESQAGRVISKMSNTELFEVLRIRCERANLDQVLDKPASPGMKVNRM